MAKLVFLNELIINAKKIKNKIFIFLFQVLSLFKYISAPISISQNLRKEK
jgi:hypothetical protein